MRALFRYHLLVFGVILLTLGGGFFLNTWVNPWRMTPAPWTAAKFEEYRGIDQLANRTAKAGLAGTGTWDAAVFGSSRANIGFDPEDPAWQGLHGVNLGLYAGRINETGEMFDYYMDRQSPKLVIFLVDVGDLSAPYPKAGLADFATSPLAGNVQPLERDLRYHVGVSASNASLQVLKREKKHQLEAHSTRGFRRQVPEGNTGTQLASLYLVPLLKTAAEREQQRGIHPAKVAKLREIVARCRAKGARLVFVIPPNHVSYQLAFPELKNPDPYFEGDRRALAEVVAQANQSDPPATPVELWDFLDAHPLNAPALPLAKGAQMENWIDLFHFRPAIGSLIVRRIRGEPGDYGMQLTPQNLPARMEQVKAGLNAWATAHPDDMAFLKKSLQDYHSLPQTTEGE